jgi:hypothetical protein
MMAELLKEGRYYEASGRVSLRGYLFVLLTGFILPLVCAPIYVMLMEGVGLVYFYLMGPFFLSSIMGGVLGRAAYWGHVRPKDSNFLQFVSSLPVATSILSSLLLLYLVWVFTIGAKFKLDELVFGMGDLFRHMRVMAGQNIKVEKVLWDTATWEYSGFWLWLMWFLEALIILVWPILVMFGTTKLGRPYCESCRKYLELEELKGIKFIHANDRSEFVRRLENRDYNALKELWAVDPTDSLRTEAELHYCPKCNGVHLLKMVAVDEYFNTPKAMNQEGPGELVMENLVVSPEALKIIKSLKPYENPNEKGPNEKVGENGI